MSPIDRMGFAVTVAWNSKASLVLTYDALEAFLDARQELTERVHGLEFSRLRDDLEHLAEATPLPSWPTAFAKWRQQQFGSDASQSAPVETMPDLRRQQAMDPFCIAATLAWATGLPFGATLDCINVLAEAERALQVETAASTPLLGLRRLRNLRSLDALESALRDFRQQYTQGDNE